MHPRVPLPPLNYHGFLPEGVHDATLEELRTRFVFNPCRTELWGRLIAFLDTAIATGHFSHVYIDGGFVTTKAEPDDIDIVLHIRNPSRDEAFKVMEPFYAKGGLKTIQATYSVDLHFWCEGFPGGFSDFRMFFQYLKPQEAAPLGLMEGARKGIVRIAL